MCAWARVCMCVWPVQSDCVKWASLGKLWEQPGYCSTGKRRSGLKREREKRRERMMTRVVVEIRIRPFFHPLLFNNLTIVMYKSPLIHFNGRHLWQPPFYWLLVTGFRRISTEPVLFVPIYLPPRLAIGQPSGLKGTLNQTESLRRVSTANNKLGNAVCFLER